MIGGELKGRGLCNLQLRIACQSVVTVEGLGLIGGVLLSSICKREAKSSSCYLREDPFLWL